MSIPTKPIELWFGRHPKAKEWAWFVVLWCGGLFAALALAYPIKFLVRAL